MGRDRDQLLRVGLVAVGLGLMLTFPTLTALPIAIAGAVAVLALTIQSPRVVVLALVVIRPVVDAFVRTQLGPVSLGQAWSVTLIAAVVIALIVDKPGREAKEPAFRPLWFALVYGFVTIPRPAAFDGLMNAMRLAAWMLLLAYLAGVCTSVDGRRLVYRTGLALGGVAAFVALGLASQGLYGAGYYFAKSQFSASGVAGPHALSSLCVLALGFPLLGTLVRGERSRFTVPIIVVLVVGVLLSFVRTSLLALAVLLFAYLFSAVGSRSRFRGFVTVVFLTLAGFAAMLTAQGLLMARIGGADAAAVSPTNPLAGSGRLLVWNAVLTKTFSTFWGAVFGYGPDASFAAVSEAVGPAIWSHNDFLEMLITGGVTLLVSYLILIAWMWNAAGSARRTAPRNHDAAPVTIIGFGLVVSYLVLSFFNGILLGQASIVLACFLGMVIGWLNQLKSSTNDEQAEGVGLLVLGNS